MIHTRPGTPSQLGEAEDAALRADLQRDAEKLKEAQKQLEEELRRKKEELDAREQELKRLAAKLSSASINSVDEAVPQQ